jgi:PAS domain S-box-containing protein
MDMHPRLEEQLRQLDLDAGTPPSAERWSRFLAGVSQAYANATHNGVLESALFRIAAVTGITTDMPAFYEAIHGIVGELMYARNCYIALFDETSNVYSFPYFVDEFDAMPDQVAILQGLTGYVIRTGEALLASEEVFEEMLASGEVELEGSPSVDWLGAPLKLGDQTIGALVVQSYRLDKRYDEKDLEILTFVSQHIATAIERKQAQKALLVQKDQYEMILENIEEVIYILDVLPGDSAPRMSFVSPRVESVLGYSVAEVLSTPEFSLSNVHPEDISQIRAFFEHVIADKQMDTNQYRRLHGRTNDYRWIEDTVVPQLDGAGRVISLFGVVRDVTERRRAEVEREVLHDSEREQRIRAETLADMTLTLTSHLGSAEVLDEILKQARRQVPCRAADISLIEGDTLHLARWQSDEAHLDDPVLVGLRQPIAEFPLVAWTMNHREAIVISDVNNEPRWTRMPDTSWIRSSLILPIVQTKQVIGLLRLNSDLPGQFNQNDVERLEPLANGAAIALTNMRLFEVERRRNEELEILHQASLRVTSSLELPSVLVAILEHAIKLGSDTLDTHIFLYDGEHLQFGGALWAGERHSSARSEPRPEGLTYTVARSGKRVVIPDVNQDSTFFADWKWGGAIVSLPLRHGDEVLGVMNVAYINPHVFAEQELRMLELLADQAAVAINNSHLYQMIAQRARQLEAVAELSKTLRGVESIEEMVPVLLSHIVELVDGQKGAIALVEPETGDLVYCRWHPHRPDLVGIRYRMGEGLVGMVAATGEAIYSDDLAEDPRAVTKGHEADFVKDIHGAISLPLRAEGKTVGVLQIGSEKGDGLGADTINVLIALAEVAGVALTRVRFRETLEDTVVERTADLARASELIRQEAERIDRLNVQLEQRQQELEATNRQLAAANQARMRFLANMSHELRTPLNGILGITQALQHDVYGDVNPQQVARLQNVLDSGAHLLNLVNDLLSLARIETHRLELRLEPVDVHTLCISAVHMVQPLIEAKNLHLETEIADDIGVLAGDVQRLRQILVNLLGNASKFTPEGGWVKFSARGRESEVEFIVCDSGIGIRAERLQRVFEPFVQADDDFDRRYAGAGLGLALVKRLTELHGGSVAVTSEIGQGSEFRVVIPRGRDKGDRWGPDFGRATPESQSVIVGSQK